MTVQRAFSFHRKAMRDTMKPNDEHHLKGIKIHALQICFTNRKNNGIIIIANVWHPHPLEGSTQLKNQVFEPHTV